MNFLQKLLIVFLSIMLISAGYLFKDSYFDNIIHYKLNIPNNEINDYYKKMVVVHSRIDSQVNNGSVIMLGDSITQGLLYQRFVNFGIGSDTTYGLLQRLNEYQSIEKSSKIILMIGINDLKRRNDKEILLNYQRILDSLPKNKLIVFSILPINKEVEIHNAEINNKRIESLNHQISKLCKEQSIRFININDEFIDQKGYLDERYHVGDGIHLNADGYNVWKKHLDNI